METSGGEKILNIVWRTPSTLIYELGHHGREMLHETPFLLLEEQLGLVHIRYHVHFHIGQWYAFFGKYDMVEVTLEPKILVQMFNLQLFDEMPGKSLLLPLYQKLHSYCCGRCKALILHCESDEFVSAITVENDNLESFSDDSSTDDVDDSSMELKVNNPACVFFRREVNDEERRVYTLFNVVAFNAVKSSGLDAAVSHCLAQVIFCVPQALHIHHKSLLWIDGSSHTNVSSFFRSPAFKNNLSFPLRLLGQDSSFTVIDQEKDYRCFSSDLQAALSKIEHPS
ncbi:unnamed protein product [Lactuca saligna]|uniref:Uncharacterized protein n=1 Tax=Lactuca saligna TaxID=75948 RepID=A0AA36E921_LACSI|nr:unnamed protein product [Lactuca saligna]